MAGLGFSQQDFSRSPSEFSGGYQVRLNLAKVLVSEPDLLLLDEPTNYLDIASIRWLRTFLTAWPRELMLITHDRGFMDGVVTHIVGIHRNNIRKIEGNTEKYYQQIAAEEEVYEKTRLNDERKRKEMELFITRFRAKARLAGLVQSRVKQMARMEKKEKLTAAKSLEFSFPGEPFKARFPFEVNKLSFSFEPDRPLIQNLDFALAAGDRVGVIGKNGRGKTTLLKLLAGKLRPTHGAITQHPNVSMGYYEQTNVSSLRSERTVEAEIMAAGNTGNRTFVRKVCGLMMFEGDDALKKIGVLSGGEKSRVMLGRLLMSPTNLLVLDEPTNHLDMDACDALLEALDEYAGSVILVTHNEMFLLALCNRLIVFDNDTVELFEGGYQRFLDTRGWSDETGLMHSVQKGADAPENSKGAPALDKKTLRRMRSEIIARKSRALKPLEKKIAALEDRIDKMETEMRTIEAGLADASQKGEGRRIATLSKDLHACQTDIETSFSHLETAAEEMENLRAGFDEELEALE